MNASQLNVGRSMFNRLMFIHDNNIKYLASSDNNYSLISASIYLLYYVVQVDSFRKIIL